MNEWNDGALMLTTDPDKPSCGHVLHDSDIHEFIIPDSSLEAAYDYLELIEPIYAARSTSSPPLRVIINSTGEALPLAYDLLRRTKALLDKYPNIGITYTAIITDDKVAARLADLFIRMARYPGVIVRFYEQAQRADAVEWLLKQR